MTDTPKTLTVTINLPELRAPLAMWNSEPTSRTYVAELTPSTELDGRLVESLTCVETGKAIGLPPYLTASNLVGWLQTTYGSDYGVTEKTTFN